MDRRHVLKLLAGGGIGGVAGCQSLRSDTVESSSSPPTQKSTRTHRTTRANTTKKTTQADQHTGTETTTTETETSTSEETGTQERRMIHVATDGSRQGTGSADDPFATVERGLIAAEPGDTVQVAPGEYQQGFETVQPGRPGKPIRIIGPAAAVVRGSVRIKHSHIYLEGLTINGLLDPANPRDVTSYQRGTLIAVQPRTDTDAYLEDIVVAPVAMGNVQRNLIGLARSKNVEVGPTRLIGLAGAEYIYGSEEGHAGEIVYIGQPKMIYERDPPNYPWSTIDQTRHVHVHHIDNSAGHPHSELVDAKVGTRDVLVEHCTDAGGSQNTEPSIVAAVRFASYDATLRWCDLRGGQGEGIRVDTTKRDWVRSRDDPPFEPEKIGTGIEIYGNRVEDFGNRGMVVTGPTLSDQPGVCGNALLGKYRTNGCGDRRQTGDTIGHDRTPMPNTQSIKPLTFTFNRTVRPSVRDPESNDARPLAVQCFAITLEDAHGDVVGGVDVETNESGVPYWEGVYGRRAGIPFRWLGGQNARSTVYLPGIADAVSLDIRAAPISKFYPTDEDIQARVSIDGQQTDQITFESTDSQIYTAALQPP